MRAGRAAWRRLPAAGCRQTQPAHGAHTAATDKTLIVWKITGDPETYGYAEKSLHGHNHFVEDVCLSSDGEYALSASWDGTLRLWNLTEGVVDKTFVDHEKDVLSCSIAPSNTKVSGAQAAAPLRHFRTPRSRRLRSCLALGTRPSSCGTWWASACTR